MGLRGEPGRAGDTGKMGPMVRRTREKIEARPKSSWAQH